MKPKLMAEAAAADFVRGLVGQILRVEVSDGRVYEGKLSCIDREKNMVLMPATQIRRTGGMLRRCAVPLLSRAPPTDGLTDTAL